MIIDNLKQTIQQMDRLQAEQRYPEAEALCNQTIEALPSSEQGHIVQISLHNRLASILEAQSRYPQALIAVHSAQKILEAIKASISPAIALSLEMTTLSTLGTLQRIQGNYAESEQSYQQAIELIETQGTEEYQSKRIQLANNLAIVYKYWGKFEAAERLYQQTLTTLQSQYGNYHPDIASIYHNLAGLNHTRGDYQTAETWARQSYQLHLDLFGAQHPKTIADGEQRGKTEEAKACFEQARAILATTLGADHPNTQVCQDNIKSLEQDYSL